MQRRLACPWLCAIPLLFGMGPWSRPAHAQDDWAITREARVSRSAPRVVAEPGSRALRTLLADPEDELAFERLIAQRRTQTGGLAALEQELSSERVRRPRAIQSSLLLARLLVASERAEEAWALLARVLTEGGDPIRTRLFRARLLQMQGAREEARVDFSWVSAQPEATSSQKQQALHALAELALAAGMHDRAREHYRELGSLGGGWRDELAFPRVLAKLGQHGEAVRAYRELLSRARGARRDLSLLLLELARSELAAGELDGALASLQRARELDQRLEPEIREVELDAFRRAGRLVEAAHRREREAQAGRVQAWREAAAIWRELADDARAVLCLRALLLRKPADIAARAELAAILQRESDFTGAELEYRRLVRDAPGNPSFVVSLSELLVASGRRAEGLALASRSSAAQPRSAPLHEALRELYARWGEHRLADQELTLLSKLEPQNPNHTLALAERALATGDRGEALELFAKLYARGDAASHRELARVLEQHDLLSEAISHARRALEITPGDAQAQRLLASLIERALGGTEAESAWQLLLHNREADEALRAEARRHLAVLWRRGGRLAQRMSELEAELRKAPEDVACMRLLAELYARDPAQGEKRIALLQRLLAQRPGDADALLALEQAELDRGAVSAALRASLRRLEGIDADDANGAERVAHALELARRYLRDPESPALVARALALRPRDAKAFGAAGAFYAARAEWELARAAFARTVELDPLAFRARCALARDAQRRGDARSARATLREIIAGATEDALVSDALSLLDSVDDGSIAPWLLERALAAPDRAVLRRFVLERELLPALALAHRVRAGEASAAEHEQLERRVAPLRSLLIAALRGQSATERLLVLPFLAAAPQSAAVDSLLALAEHDERSLQERAEALLSLGHLRDAAALARLRTLVSGANRRLRPLALWAASESAAEAAAAELRPALEQRDEAVCAMAAVLAGQRRESSLAPRLRALVADGRDVVSAAALWALSRIEPDASYELAWARLRSAPSELAVVALAQTAEYAAEGLLSPDRRSRRAAVALMHPQLASEGRDRSSSQPEGMATSGSPSRSLVLARARSDSPAWPFDVRHYLVQVARSTTPLRQHAAEQHDQVIAAAAARLLRGSPEQALETLAALVPEADGLTLRAFVEAGVCLPPQRGQALAERLREPIASLAAASHPALRVRALALLVESGGSERPEVRRALASGDREQIHAVLLALGELDAHGRLPDALRAAIVPFLRDPSWPVRMHAARALRHAQTSPQLTHDPIALVRAAGGKSAPIQRCPARPEGAAN